jgi:hypothetical protein
MFRYDSMRDVISTLQAIDDVACSACSVIRGLCRWIKSTKAPASGASNVSEPRQMSQVATVREVECAWIGVFLQPEGRRCQYSSAYVAAAAM